MSLLDVFRMFKFLRFDLGLVQIHDWLANCIFAWTFDHLRCIGFLSLNIFSIFIQNLKVRFQLYLAEFWTRIVCCLSLLSSVFKMYAFVIVIEFWKEDNTFI